MGKTLFGLRGGVLEKCFGRTAGEGAELRYEVRLIGVAAGERELSPTHGSGEAASSFEPQQARCRLGWEADLLAETRHEPFPAPAELRGDRDHADASGGAAESLPRPN